MKLLDIMVTDLLTVQASDSVYEAVVKMRDRKTGCVMVMQDHRPVGIYTERDLLRTVENEVLNEPVSHYMTSSIIYGHPDMSLDEAEKLMRDGGFRHLPVKNGETLVGMISTKDLFKACHNEELMKRQQLEIIQKMIVTYSHEIKNPLSIIIGNLFRAKFDPPEILQKVENAGDRINEVLKKISKLESINEIDYSEKQSMIDIHSSKDPNEID